MLVVMMHMHAAGARPSVQIQAYWNS